MTLGFDREDIKAADPDKVPIPEEPTNITQVNLGSGFRKSLESLAVVDVMNNSKIVAR